LGLTDEDSIGFHLKIKTTVILPSNSTDENFKQIRLKMKTVTI